MKEQMLTIYKWSQKIGNNDTEKNTTVIPSIPRYFWHELFC